MELGELSSGHKDKNFGLPKNNRNVKFNFVKYEYNK